ncbi:MAG: SDR family oxidoreductase [Alphaproteobacteria bacterium]|nr:MAG: SDR family oxidoreductase [Alphaproteobacteria bacterium]
MDGKVAIITGATSGIGAAAAILFAKEGARIVAAGRREDRGAELVDTVKAAGGEITFVTADMGSDADIKAMVDTAVNTYGGLDYAFNNAGMGGDPALLHEYDDDNWQQVINVNLTGVYRCMKYEIAAMLPSGAKSEFGACIVNNASTLGHRGSELSGIAYTASKHGLIGLTRQAAINYVQQNIRINAVSPGATHTELLSGLLDQGPEAAAMLAAINPIGRLGTAEEVAHAALFLCSDGARMITGHSLPVDGGQMAHL